MLELISYFLVVNYNSNQQKIFQYSSNVITGSILNKTQNLRNYLNLTEIADSLALENAQLKSQLYAYRRNDQESSIEQLVVNFDLIPARISNNSISARHNSFTLNKGKIHGIKSEMGVINSNGVIGIVRYVSQNYSTAISILNPDMRISTKIKGSNYFGILRWNGMNINEFELIDIPKYANVELGDTIITSSYSSIFPEGLTLGVIKKIDLKQGSNTFDIEVHISVKPESTKYGYVIKNKNFKEIKSLEELMKENN